MRETAHKVEAVLAEPSPALVSVTIVQKSSLKGLKPDPLQAAYENAYESYVALEALKTMSHLASMA